MAQFLATSEFKWIDPKVNTAAKIQKLVFKKLVFNILKNHVSYIMIMF